jgi:hypothetical protein
MLLIRIIAGLLLLQSMAFALQQKTAPRESQPEQQKNVVSYFRAENAGYEQTIVDLPFTAKAVMETTQALADGNRFVTHSSQILARDSKGRTHREQAIRRIGALQMDGPTMVFIYDPVAKLQYSLDPAEHTARISKLKTISLSGPQDSTPSSHEETGNRRITRESLGSKTMEGLTVQGYRTTVEFAAGAAGNEKPFTVSAEVWYSPDLQADILRIRKDPRVGETVYRLTEIQRGDPDPGLFQVPTNYKILRDAPPATK